MRSLIGNDLRLHGRGIGWVQVGALGFIALLIWAYRASPSSTPAANASFIFNVNFLLAVLWGEWLVSREKTKGTLAWLRSLPVSDKVIVTAKFLACALCVICLWVLSSLLFVHGFFFPTHWANWCVYLLGLLAFATCSLAGRWRFRQKVGMMLPLVVVLVPLLAVLLADQAGTHILKRLATFYLEPNGKTVIAAALVVFCTGVWWATASWVSRSNTFELLE